MNRFQTQDGLQRAVQFLDRIGRAAWEPFHRNEQGFPVDEPVRGTYYDNNGDPFRSYWEAVAGIMGMAIGLLNNGAAKLGRSPVRTQALHGFDLAEPNSSWTQFEYEKLFDILISNEIVSVADAMVKTTGYLSAVRDPESAGQGRYLFRGQTDIGWPLRPQMGRYLHDEIQEGRATPPADPLTITDLELGDLGNFQSAWPVATADELDKLTAANLAPDSAVWWMLMQHYADGAGHGTRLLDVTTSLLFGLLFACVEWETGTVDGDRDGVVYLFMEGQNALAHDYLVEELPEAQEVFRAPHDVLHMVLSPPHNERSKAQSGGFLWWSEFWTPIGEGVPYLRIPGGNKEKIVRELLSFGVGPKEAVRGRKGLENERNLRQALGLGPWEPRGL